MKPICLTMQAFCSYGEKTVIDFSRGGDFFLISGDTGSGKSSIFDALMFALYGEISAVSSGREKELASQFADNGVTPPYVDLVFEVQQKTYRVHRTPKYNRPSKRKGANPQSMTETAELYLPDKTMFNGKLAETNARIQELVGLTADQFRKVVMIAQGEFMNFLRADSNAKTELLRDLLKTDLYRRLIDKIKDDANSKAAARSTLAAKYEVHAARIWTDGLTAEDAEMIGQLKDEVMNRKAISPESVDRLVDALSDVCGKLKQQENELTKVREAAQQRRDEQMKQLEKAKQLAMRFDELALAEQVLTECAAQAEDIGRKRQLIGQIRSAWVLHDRYENVSRARKSLTDAQKELERQEERLPSCCEAAESARARKRQADEQRTNAAAAQAKVMQQTKAALDLFARAKTAEADVQKAKRQAEDAEKRLKSAQAEIEKLHQQKEAWEKREQELQGAEVEVQRCNQQRKRLEALQNQFRELKGNSREISRYGAAAEKLMAQYRQASGEYDAAKAQYDAYRTAFLNAQAGLLASELKDGEPCPVCGSREHPSPCRLTQDDRKLTREALAQYRTEMETRAKRQEELASSSRSAQDVLTEKRQKQQENETRLLQELCQELPETDAQSAAEAEIVLREWENQLTAATAAAQEKQRALLDVREKLNGAKGMQQTLEIRLEEARKADSTSSTERAKAENTLASLHADIARSGYASGEDANKAQAVVKDALKSAEEEANLQNLRHQAAEKEKTACETRIRQLKEDMPRLSEEASTLDSKYWQLLAEQAMSEADWQSLTHTYDAQQSDVFQAEISRFENRQSGAAAQRDTARKAIGTSEKPDMKQLKSAYEEANHALTDAASALESVSTVRQNNAAVLGDLQVEQAKFAKVSAAAATSAHLSSLMSGNESGSRMNLETYVQRRYMETILQNANRRFRSMSGDQFELRLLDLEKAGIGTNKGLNLEVYSIVTGKTRTIGTLSGGESFMAALSLALGMADQIQAATAAIHLDVMFIDEGFGSLDDRARNEAVNVLKQMAGDKRQIGIISHVTELKDEIENQLIVRKTDRGSSATWRT